MRTLREVVLRTVMEVPELATMVIGRARRGGDPPHHTGLL